MRKNIQNKKRGGGKELKTRWIIKHYYKKQRKRREKDWDENPEIINVHVKKDYSNQEEDKKDDKPGNKSWERIFKTREEGGGKEMKTRWIFKH